MTWQCCLPLPTYTTHTYTRTVQADSQPPPASWSCGVHTLQLAECQLSERQPSGLNYWTSLRNLQQLGPRGGLHHLSISGTRTTAYLTFIRCPQCYRIVKYQSRRHVMNQLSQFIFSSSSSLMHSPVPTAHTSMLESSPASLRLTPQPNLNVHWVGYSGAS